MHWIIFVYLALHNHGKLYNNQHQKGGNMTKNFLILAGISLLFMACSNNQSSVNEPAEQEEIFTLAVNTFDTVAEEYIGKVVRLEGTVAHVCKHGGKRMFIMDDNPDIRVKVTVGESIPSFDVELEGSDVVVQGMVDELRIDEAYLIQWEEELASQPEEEHEAGEGEHGPQSGLGEKADQGDHAEAYEMIAEYREQLAASEKGYLAFYSIICDEFSVTEDQEITEQPEQ